MTEPTPPPHEPDPVEPVAGRSDHAPGSPPASDPGEPRGPMGEATPIDRAASAVLDGLPLDDEGRSVDPAELDRRVHELTAVTALLAAPVPPPEPTVVDAHIEAAIAAHAAASAPADIDPVRPAVASLADRRRRPAVGRWLAVAAAVAVIALAIPVLRSLSESSSTSSDTAASVADSTDNADGAEATADDQTLSPTKSGAGAAATTTPAGRSDATIGSTSGGNLGSADTDLALTALVQQAAPDATGHPTTQSSSADGAISSSTTMAPSFTRSAGPTCDATTRASHPELGALRYSATATYRSVPVEVAVYEVPDPITVTYRLIATAVDGCQVLVDRTYP